MLNQNAAPENAFTFCLQSVSYIYIHVCMDHFRDKSQLKSINCTMTWSVCGKQ